MITLKVPATTANIGPGFDCLGMALNMYNTIEVYDDVDKLIIQNNPPHQGIEANEDNLIYKSFKRLYDDFGMKVPPVKIVQNITIPTSRGLGSSSACIVAGLTAANEMMGRRAGKEKLLDIATDIEGHPDNVAPALLGGLVISAKVDKEVKYIQYPISTNIKLMALIPNFTLSTKMARSVLPSAIDYKDAVFNVSRASLLTASLITGNLENIRYAVEDRLHQPYRLRLITDGEKIRDTVYDCGAEAFFISGSGSTLMAIIKDTTIADKVDSFLKRLNTKWEIKLLNIDNDGVRTL